MATVATNSAYVVDASVALKGYLGEAGSDEAKALFFLAANGDISLRAPELLQLEVSNILAREVRRNKLQVSDARAASESFRLLPIEQFPDRECLDSAFELALAHQQTVYDCVYLALALRLGCPFITADARFHSGMAKAFPMVLMLGRSLPLL